MTKYNTLEERKFASNEQNKKWYQDHKEQLKVYSRERYKNNPELKERQLAQQRKKYHEDEIYKAKQKGFYKNKIEVLNNRIIELS
jgi:hypothetical protein